MSNLTQDHIHLDPIVSVFGDYAPVTRFRVTRDGYAPVPVVFQDLKRGITGRLRVHSLSTGVNAPVQIVNYHMVLRLTQETATDTSYFNDSAFLVGGVFTVDGYLAKLQSMNGQVVFFVPNNHCPDGTNHTPFVKSYHLSIKDVKPFSQALETYHVAVELTDNTI